MRALPVAESWELMAVDAVDAEVLGDVDIAARDGVSGRSSKVGSCYHVKTRGTLDRTSKQTAQVAIYIQGTITDHVQLKDMQPDMYFSCRYVLLVQVS